MTMTKNSGRRRFLLGTGGALLAGTLTGCSSSPVAKSFNVWAEQQFGGDRFTREQVEQLPYATMAAGIGKLPRAMLVLGRTEGSDLHWFSADKGVLVTRRGRLIRTVGLADGNLAATIPIDEDPLSLALEESKTPRRWRRLVDILPSRQMGVLLTAEWRPDGEERIATLHGEKDTVRIRETSLASHAGWQLENIFWLDRATGETLATSQQVLPGGATIRTEILKPYRERG